jgi:hypothetical protein
LSWQFADATHENGARGSDEGRHAAVY